MKAITKHMLYYVLLAAVGLCVYLALSGHAQAAETAVTASQGLEGALVDIIQQVSGGVKQGVDFLQAEVPDVIRQLLVWKAVEAGIWAALHLLLIIAGIAAFANGYKVIVEQNRLEAIETAAENARDAASRHHESFLSLNSAHTTAYAEAQAHISKTVIGCIIGAIWTIVGIVSMCNIWGHIMTVAQIYLAPKVWLIEYAASLVK
ncbi:MAG: hypothetical protein [Bacteriophage sp.]|nr:MAG: hypothetical protein [Bacteriophage sp.]